MGRLRKYLTPEILFIILTLAIKFAGTYVELMIPDLMETVIDVKVPEAKAAGGNLNQVFLYGGLMLLCAALALAGNIIANRMSAISSGRITRRLRHDLFNKLENLSSKQMDDMTVSSAESRLTSDTYNVNQLLARLQRIGIRAPILLIGGVIQMVKMDTVLALVLIALLPVICITVYFVTKNTVPLYRKTQDIQDELVQVCQENITGIRVIKALSKTEYEKGRFNEVNTRHSATGLKAGIINNITNPVTNLSLNIGLVLVVVVGARRVNAGACQGGVIIAFLQYFTMILNATLGITRVFIMWSKGQASAHRIADVLELPEDLTVQPAGEAESNAPHIEFRNVSFSYTGVGLNVDNLSFKLERGQTLGIIGATGAGKTVILKLLLRLYDPQSGQILIDGKDIRTYSREELSRKFGVVFQNDFIAEGTVADNIRFFRDIPEEQVEKAARDAQADFIWEKPGALDYEIVVRGNNISGGQKQRLLIARALASDPEILVLDDVSSALDYRTDSNLRKALRQNYRNTTTLLVAQRVSSLKHADRILVISDSTVIGSGTHEQLMETCEDYCTIANAQMGERKEGA